MHSIRKKDKTFKEAEALLHKFSTPDTDGPPKESFKGRKIDFLLAHKEWWLQRRLDQIDFRALRQAMVEAGFYNRRSFPDTAWQAAIVKLINGLKRKHRNHSRTWAK